MNLLMKELKICGYDALLAIISIYFFISCIMYINPSVKYYVMVGFIEVCIPIIAAIKCSYILDNKNDMEIIMVNKMSIGKIILFKYFVNVGTIILVGVIEIVLFNVMHSGDYSYEFIIALVSTTICISSIALVLTILSKSTGSGTVITGIIWIGQIGIGKKLSQYKIGHPWYERISFYNTLFKFNSPLWIQSKVTLLIISFIIFVLVAIILKKRERIFL